MLSSSAIGALVLKVGADADTDDLYHWCVAKRGVAPWKHVHILTLSDWATTPLKGVIVSLADHDATRSCLALQAVSGDTMALREVAVAFQDGLCLSCTASWLIWS